MKFGTNDTDNFMIGSGQVDKIMLGTEEVWKNFDTTVGMVSHWNFYNDAVDSIGSKNGTEVGTISYDGRALQLPGSESDYVTLGDTARSDYELYPYSISVWVNFDTLDTGGDIYVVNNHARAAGNGSTLNGGACILYYRANNKLLAKYFFQNDETTTDTNGYIDTGYTASATYSEEVLSNTWYHIVAVFEQNKLTLYINGEYESEVTSTQDNKKSSDETLPSYSFGILDYISSGTHYPLDGQLSNVRHYKSVLNAEFVKAIYDEEKSLYI